MKWASKYFVIGLVVSVIFLLILISLRENTELAAALSTWAVLVVAIFAALSLQYSHEQTSQLKYEQSIQGIRQWALECLELALKIRDSDELAREQDTKLGNLVSEAMSDNFVPKAASQRLKDAVRKAKRPMANLSTVWEKTKAGEVEKAEKIVKEATNAIRAILFALFVKGKE